MGIPICSGKWSRAIDDKGNQRLEEELVTINVANFPTSSHSFRLCVIPPINNAVLPVLIFVEYAHLALEPKELPIRGGENNLAVLSICGALSSDPMVLYPNYEKNEENQDTNFLEAIPQEVFFPCVMGLPSGTNPKYLFREIPGYPDREIGVC